MNKPTFYIVLALALSVVLGAFYWYSGVAQAPVVEPESQAGIANPASTNCVAALGGTLEIVDTAAGQVGICHLPDGRSCEEWALFRDGTCTNG